VKVLFYGRLADVIGRQVDVDSAATVGEIRSLLLTSHPAAGEALRKSRAFVADCLVTDERRLSESETAEFLPPVSGG
jgi:molybdopterin converting factor small subunit